MVRNSLPPQSYLRECFRYNRKTGELRWKRRPPHHFKRRQDWKTWNTRQFGKIAGCDDMGGPGYKLVRISGKIYRASRLIWKLITGNGPTEDIDHRNGNPSDDRWFNLRDATHQQNQQNRRKLRTGKAKLKGAIWDKARSKWMATARMGDYTARLGRFDNEQDAHKAYVLASKALHGEFHNPGH